MAQRVLLRAPRVPPAEELHPARGLHLLAAAAAAAAAAEGHELRSAGTGRRVWRQTLFKVTVNSQMAFDDSGGVNNRGYRLGEVDALLRDAAYLMGRRATEAIWVARGTYGSAEDIVRAEASRFESLTTERGGRMRFAHIQFNIVVTHYLHKTHAGPFGPRLDIVKLRAIAYSAFRQTLSEQQADALARRLRFFIEVSDTPAGAHSYATKDSPAYDDTLPPVNHGYAQTFPREGWTYPNAFDNRVFNKVRPGKELDDP